jgi:hypothetical protein
MRMKRYNDTVRIFNDFSSTIASLSVCVHCFAVVGCDVPHMKGKSTCLTLFSYRIGRGCLVNATASHLIGYSRIPNVCHLIGCYRIIAILGFLPACHETWSLKFKFKLGCSMISYFLSCNRLLTKIVQESSLQFLDTSLETFFLASLIFVRDKRRNCDHGRLRQRRAGES